MTVGNYGNGTLNLSGSSLLDCQGTFYAGKQLTSNNNYITMSDFATFLARGDGILGDLGSVDFTQNTLASVGHQILGTLYMAVGESSDAEYTLTNGLLSANAEFIGVWNFTPPAAFDFSSADLTFRYDDALANIMNILESDLRIYHYTANTWLDVTSHLDLTNHLIKADGILDFSLFAVAQAPEPTTVLLIIAGLTCTVGRTTMRKNYGRRRDS